jgi:hypothetical protein
VKGFGSKRESLVYDEVVTVLGRVPEVGRSSDLLSKGVGSSGAWIFGSSLQWSTPSMVGSTSFRTRAFGPKATEQRSEQFTGRLEKLGQVVVAATRQHASWRRSLKAGWTAPAAVLWLGRRRGSATP